MLRPMTVFCRILTAVSVYGRRPGAYVERTGRVDSVCFCERGYFDLQFQIRPERALRLGSAGPNLFLKLN